MHSNFHRYIKPLGKIRFLVKSVINSIFLCTSQSKIDIRSCEDRREYSYTAYIPERRSGKDRRKNKIVKNSFDLTVSLIQKDQQFKEPPYLNNF